MIICALCLAIASPLFAQKKEEERLSNSATVFRAILAGPLPTNILDQASCVVIFPSVKKVAIGIGGSYGRGALVCRSRRRSHGRASDGLQRRCDARGRSDVFAKQRAFRRSLAGRGVNGQRR